MNVEHGIISLDETEKKMNGRLEWMDGELSGFPHMRQSAFKSFECSSFFSGLCSVSVMLRPVDPAVPPVCILFAWRSCTV